MAGPLMAAMPTNDATMAIRIPDRIASSCLRAYANAGSLGKEAAAGGIIEPWTNNPAKQQELEVVRREAHVGRHRARHGRTAGAAEHVAGGRR